MRSPAHTWNLATACACALAGMVCQAAAHGRAPQDAGQRKANAFEFAYSYLAPEFNMPCLCEKIAADAVLTAPWGGQGHQITFTRSDCFFYMALKTGDASYCDRVRPAAHPILDGRAMTPENCRAAVALGGGLNSHGGDGRIILDVLGFDPEYEFEPPVNGYLLDWGSPEFVARLSELPDFSQGQPDLDALRVRMRERHARYERQTIDAPQGLGKPKLHWAAREGALTEIQRLLALGASTHIIVGPNGDTLMHDVAWPGRIELIALVMHLGVSIDARNRHGSTALHLAASNDRAESVTSLLRAGADIEAIDKLGRRPLHWACVNPAPAAVDLLLQRGADPDAVDDAGDTPLLLVVRGMGNATRLRIVDALLCAGADINARDRRGLTALEHIALATSNPRYGDSIQQIRRLLEAHASAVATERE